MEEQKKEGLGPSGVHLSAHLVQVFQFSVNGMLVAYLNLNCVYSWHFHVLRVEEHFQRRIAKIQIGSSSQLIKELICSKFS